MARFGTGEPRELQAKGVMTERVASAFQAAREWLLRVRIAMHHAAGRRQDQLRFALQEAVAPILCPDAKAGEGDIRPAVAPGRRGADAPVSRARQAGAARDRAAAAARDAARRSPPHHGAGVTGRGRET